MFTRIMAVVLSVILVLTAVVTFIAGITLEKRETASIMEELRDEAREIAYLASQGRSGYGVYGGNNAQEYLQWKAARVYDEFGAYIVVVDRNGRVMDNMSAAYAGNPGFAATLDARELAAGLTRVLAGEEIELHVMLDGNAYFTVGVPFVQGGYVLGAVLMQTPAQRIEGNTSAMLWSVVGIAALASVTAGLILFFYLRGVMKPLRRLTGAARAMAEGNFAVRVPQTRATPEVAALSQAFNTMSDKLGEVESSRREFVANVSHELRSPITAISGYVEGMLDGVIPPENYEKYLAIVSDETRRLSKLIGELLALSRLERDDAALNLTQFDVCDLLERVFLRRADELEKRGMDVECDFRPEPCMVKADAARIEQVIVNLIDNAMKFTPDGGKITLRVRTQGRQCAVVVQDNGMGIQPEDRDRVFDRFFTADRAHTSGKGTGLGLSICQRIMEMHGQRIQLLDTAEGAAFAFTLALAA